MPPHPLFPTVSIKLKLRDTDGLHTPYLPPSVCTRGFTLALHGRLPWVDVHATSMTSPALVQVRDPRTSLPGASGNPHGSSAALPDEQVGQRCRLGVYKRGCGQQQQQRRGLKKSARSTRRRAVCSSANARRFSAGQKAKPNNKKRNEEVAAADVLGIPALPRGGGGGWRFGETKCATTDPNSGATPGFYFM